MIFGKLWPQILLFIGLFFIVVVVAFLIFRLLLDKPYRRFWIAGILGMLVNLVCIFMLQQNSHVIAEDPTPIARLRNMRTLLPGNDTVDKRNIRDFFLINTAKNLKILTNDYSTTPVSIAVTDRIMLSRVLKFLATEVPNLDLVVCDLIFPEPDSTADRQLAIALDMLAKDKLVLAYNHEAVMQNPEFYKNFNRSVFGDVANVQGEPFYFSTQLENENGMPCMSYAIYLKIKHLSIPKSRWLLHEPDGWAARNYIPEFSFTQDSVLHPKKMDFTAKNFLLAPAGHYYDLGELSLWENQIVLKNSLMQKSKSPKVVLIGSLSDPQVDVHQTAYGALHGLTIIVNEYDFLASDYHLHSIVGMIFFFLLQWTAYSGIFLYIFWRNIYKVKKEKDKKATTTYSAFKELWSSLVQFLFDEIHYVLLLLVALGIEFQFHRLTNFVTLFYFFILFSYLLEYFTKRHLYRKKHEKT